ncbi:MAG TPA: 3-hydroxyacyl-CoA dehydrogenase family protein [Anaerolineae bacterium]|nr:3-hydroxyacyl-CoA dehydrogenase family protein [Anaerolineae bacterium]
MQIRQVGVVGAGVMGRGVAQRLAQYGCTVRLIDQSETVLEQASAEIRHNIRLAQLLGKADRNQTPNQILDQITFTTDLTQLHNVDFLVENIVEKWTAKRDLYPQLDAICPAHTVFAANTSCISITKLGSITQRADRIVGMHFMNPVPLKSTVEMIRGYHTSPETIAIAQTFLAGIGMDAVIVNDSPGFVSNRVLMLTINEAAYLVYEGVAQPSEVDAVFTKCFGHPMGPLATGDLIGLDTILYSVDVLYESYNDSKYRPCPLLKKMVDAGLHGRKTGEGFFTYAK